MFLRRDDVPVGGPVGFVLAVVTLVHVHDVELVRHLALLTAWSAQNDELHVTSPTAYAEDDLAKTDISSVAWQLICAILPA